MDSGDMLSDSTVDCTLELDFTVSDISSSTLDSEDSDTPRGDVSIETINSPKSLRATEDTKVDKEAADNIAENEVESENDQKKDSQCEDRTIKKEDANGNTIIIVVNGSNEAHKDENEFKKVEINCNNEEMGSKTEEINIEEKIIDTNNAGVNIKHDGTNMNTEETNMKNGAMDDGEATTNTEELNSNHEESTHMRIGVGRTMKEVGGGDALASVMEETGDCGEFVEELGEKSSNELVGDDYKLNLVKKCRVKLPMKGERFRVKFADNFHVPHKLYLKNMDKVDKGKLNMMLAKKIHEPLTSMPMSRLKEKGHVLIKFKKPAKLIRAQVKWIQSRDNKIQVQDIDSGALYIVSHENIYVLDDENIANIYPRVFVCNLSEFDGKDIYWNSLIRDLYISTLRAGHLSIEIRTFHHTVLSYDVHLKLYFFDDKKFVNLNEWLANSFIPYLVFLKTRPGSVPQSVADYPTEVFFPYVKLFKDA